MIISAVDLDKLSDEDLEDLAKKFERDDEEGEGSTEPSMDDTTAPEPDAAPAPAEPQAELGEDNDPMAKLAEFVDTPAYQEDHDDQPIHHSEDHTDDLDDDGLEWSTFQHGDGAEEMDEEKEIDLDEIKRQISAAVSHTLSNHFN